jgi:hypothetical protein
MLSTTREDAGLASDFEIMIEDPDAKVCTISMLIGTMGTRAVEGATAAIARTATMENFMIIRSKYNGPRRLTVVTRAGEDVGCAMKLRQSNTFPVSRVLMMIAFVSHQLLQRFGFDVAFGIQYQIL